MSGEPRLQGDLPGQLDHCVEQIHQANLDLDLDLDRRRDRPVAACVASLSTNSAVSSRLDAPMGVRALAVAVAVCGQRLGYPPRDVVAIYQPALLAATKAGGMPHVGARVYARKDTRIPGGQLNSVRVDLAPLAVITAR